eukprot:TRINITY_DN4546_c0_g1_i2.p1 TRINITY_DN4546_c0_g1~~TRINITY_DN4546_c0_g1_i2.p1  ORF type:complete len:784 (-),score=228.62 TRINITY_DN4546_c0_g1_i2:377-2449(-)
MTVLKERKEIGDGDGGDGAAAGAAAAAAEPRLKVLTQAHVMRLKALKTDKIRDPTMKRGVSKVLVAKLGKHHRVSPETQQPVTSSGEDDNDPFLRERPTQGFSSWFMMVALLGIVQAASWLMVLLCFGVDNLTQRWPHPHLNDNKGIIYYDYSFVALLYTMFNPTPEQTRSLLQSLNNTMAFVFALLISIIGIVLQFASERTTPHVTTLFFKDKFILSLLMFVLVSNAFVMYVYLEAGDVHWPRSSVVLCTFVASLQLVLLVPFLAYMFLFLDTEMVATNIVENGVNAVVRAINEGDFNTLGNQQQAMATIEHLMDGAFASIKKKHHNISSEIVDALCSYCMHYISIKHMAPEPWFDVPPEIRSTPDFLILNEESFAEVKARKVWVEWKVLRQYQTLFSEAVRWYPELCYHICINTRLLGWSAALQFERLRGLDTQKTHNPLHTLDLCVKYFNTYLRAGINDNHVRVVYNTLFQYRQFAQSLLDIRVGATLETVLRALKIAKYMRYYAWVCQTRGISFLVETVAQDLRVICQVAVTNIALLDQEGGVHKGLKFFWDVHYQLLEVFMSVADFVDRSSKRGVMSANVNLAAFYLGLNYVMYARKIFFRLKKEPSKELLVSLKSELESASTKEFWEVSERGTNFNYLEPNLRENLNTLYGWFEWPETLEEIWARYKQTADGAQLRIMQVRPLH